jgi:hypothetical protein
MASRSYTHEFGFHPANDVTGPLHHAIREVMLATAQEIEYLVPDGVEKTESIKHLRLAMFWANAAIACNLAELEE